MEKNFYITTPIYYTSGKFHIGHCYTTIIADAIARYKRYDGYDVLFQTGTDEHGQKIEVKASEAGLSPQEFVDEIVDDAKDLWSKLGITYDKFVRTSSSEHKEVVQKIFTKLYESGDIYKGTYEGLYCTPCESFWTESQLVDGKCPDCGREVKLVEEESYFFKLSKYQDRLLDLYNNDPKFLLPIARKNELVNGFIKPGLEDLCVTRTSVEWGIEVPIDPKHTIYVWIDALSNYITTLGYPDEDSELFKKFWPADIHLVGKEITRFHAIIWPALLMALDIELPKQVFSHGWLVINGDKISKSLGNYEDPREYIKEFGSDAVKYYTLKEVPVGSDGAFSTESLIAKINSDLANTLGNLVTRTVSMSHKYFDGYVNNMNVNNMDEDNELINAVNNLKERVDKSVDDLKLNDALENIMEVLRLSNKYIDVTTPWILAKDESSSDRLNTVLYNLIESIRVCSILLQAFIPDTSKIILDVLGSKLISFDDTKFGLLEDNLLLGESKVIFSRIDN